MLYNVIVCDDERNQIEVIKDHLAKFSSRTGVEFSIDTFLSGIELLKEYKTNTKPYQIIFLDMEMDGISGMETAQVIRDIPDNNVQIVFVTSYPEYMPESFDVQAAQYLCKPVSYDLFEEKLSKLINFLKSLETNITVITLDGNEMIIHLDDIISIESDKGSMVKILTRTGQINVRAKIAELSKNLKDKYFVLVHRTCIANMKYVRRFNGDVMEFTSGRTVDVSRRRINEVKEAFSKYMVMRYKR